MNSTANTLPSNSADEVDTVSALAQFASGFLGLMPLWTGAIPVGVAYAVAARDVGLSPITTQLMSLTVFSAAAQLSAVSLFAHGTPVIIMILTVLSLNLQVFLYGLAASRDDPSSPARRLLTAYFLTDGAFAIAVAAGRIRLPVLLGAGVSMFTAWNLGTLLGLISGTFVPDVSRFGVSFVAPLIFLAVLVPLLKTRPALLTAAVAAVTAVVLMQWASGGVAVLGAGLCGSLAGSWYAGRPPFANRVQRSQR